MANLFLCNEAELEWLKRVVNNATPDNFILRLFKNSVVPADDDVVADYTELTEAGYSAATLTGASWSAQTNGEGKAEVSYAQQSFQPTVAVDVYGAYLTNTAGTILLGVAPFTEEITGDLASGNAIITNVSDVSKLKIGQNITASNLPAGTTISSIDSSTQITVSQNATETEAGADLVAYVPKELEASGGTINITPALTLSKEI